MNNKLEAIISFWACLILASTNEDTSTIYFIAAFIALILYHYYSYKESKEEKKDDK